MGSRGQAIASGCKWLRGGWQLAVVKRLQVAALGSCAALVKWVQVSATICASGPCQVASSGCLWGLGGPGRVAASVCEGLGAWPWASGFKWLLLGVGVPWSSGFKWLQRPCWCPFEQVASSGVEWSGCAVVGAWGGEAGSEQVASSGMASSGCAVVGAWGGESGRRQVASSGVAASGCGGVQVAARRTKWSGFKWLRGGCGRFQVAQVAQVAADDYYPPPCPLNVN